MTHSLEIFDLYQEDAPKWWEMGMLRGVEGNSGPEIILSIASSSLVWFTDRIRVGGLRQNYADLLMESGLRGEFVTDVTKQWGFDGAFYPPVQHDFFAQAVIPPEGFTTFRIPIPCVHVETNRVCPTCGGTARNEDLGRECLSCDGYGRENEGHWWELDKIAATMALLSFMLLDNPLSESLTGINKGRQLLSLLTPFSRDLFSVSGTVSPTMFSWFRNNGRRNLNEVRAVMEEVWLHMFPRHRSLSELGFQARINEGGQLILVVPGNATSVYIDQDDIARSGQGEGAMLQCSNVDSRAQQLALMAGLAAVCDVARREGVES